QYTGFCSGIPGVGPPSRRHALGMCIISSVLWLAIGVVMQEFLPHVLVNHSFTVHSAIDVRDAPRVVTVEVQPGQPIQVPTHRMEPVPAELRAAFKGPIQNMRAEIIKLQLRASYDMVQVMLKGLDEPDYPIRG